MRYVSGFFTFLVALLLLCSSVFASEFGMDDLPTDSPEEATESVSSYVSLDPNTIQDLVDALNDAWDSRDALSDDTTNPVIDISPDSVEDLASSIGSVISNSMGSDSAIPYSNEELSDGYYFVCNCVLGDNLKFCVPVEFAVGGFAKADTGELINMTSNTFSTTFRSGRKTYIITAPSMSYLTYYEMRSLPDGESIQTFDLNETVIDSNMSFLHDTPQAVPDSTYWIVLIAVCILGFLLIAFFKR